MDELHPQRESDEGEWPEIERGEAGRGERAEDEAGEGGVAGHHRAMAVRAVQGKPLP